MSLDEARAVVAANLPGMYSRRDHRGVDRLARILQSLDIAHAVDPRPVHADLLRVWQTEGWQSSDPAALAAVTVAATLRPDTLAPAEQATLATLSAGGAA
jgi:hypothetical protein